MGRSIAGARALAWFFRADFPGTFIAEARFFWAALGLLAAGALVGAVAALVGPASMDGVVPETVREHLEADSLRTDSPIAAASPVMGSTIAANNMGVALSVFGLGLTAGLGTAAMLLFNGLHLGENLALCFQAKLDYRLLGGRCGCELRAAAAGLSGSPTERLQREVRPKSARRCRRIGARRRRLQ